MSKTSTEKLAEKISEKLKRVEDFTPENIDKILNCAHKVEDYRKYTEYGVTTVSYHVGLTKTWIFAATITVVPGLFALGDQAFNDGKIGTTDMCHYFDSNTGQEISYSQAQDNKNRNREADALDTESSKLINDGKYNEASNKYGQAYSRCTSGYQNAEKFSNCKDACNLAAQAQNLLNTGKFSEAKDKFQEAVSLSNLSEIRSEFSNCMDACNIAVRAQDLFSSGKFSEARAKFQEAYNLSNVSEIRSKLSNCRDACSIAAEAQNLINTGKFSEAKTKFQEAYNLSNASEIRSILLNYKSQAEVKAQAQARVEAENKIKNNEAEALNKQGLELFNQSKYNEAAIKFNEAHSKCSIGYANAHIFKSYRKEAKVELEAQNLSNEGDKLFNEGKYQEALEKYTAAHTKSGIMKECLKYRVNKNKATAEVDAINLNDQGDKLFNECKYQEAKNKYQEACDKSKVSSNYDKYTANVNRALEAIEQEAIKQEEAIRQEQINEEEQTTKLYDQASELYNQGWAAEDNDRLEEAEEVFNKALEESLQAMKSFPKSTKLKEIHKSVSLKIEGNKIFNEGADLREEGELLLKKQIN